MDDVRQSHDIGTCLTISHERFAETWEYPFSCGDRAATVSFPPPITGSSCRFAASDRTRRETNPRPCTRAAGNAILARPCLGPRWRPEQRPKGSPPAAPPIQLYLAGMCPAPDFQLDSF